MELIFHGCEVVKLKMVYSHPAGDLYDAITEVAAVMLSRQCTSAPTDHGARQC